MDKICGNRLLDSGTSLLGKMADVPSFTKQIVALAFHVLLLNSLAESAHYDISRGSNNRKEDSFTVPSFECTRLSSQPCSSFGAARDPYGSGHCECHCPNLKATFGMFSKSWKCIENTQARAERGRHY